MFNLFLPFTDDRDILMLSIFNDFIINNQDKLKYNNCNLFSVYGTFPGTIWNGGRSLANYFPKMNKKQIEERIKFFNDKNIKVHLTFTNNMLEEQHLNDKYCNDILDIADNNKDNCIIIGSELLKNYIKKNHPNLKLSASITIGNDFNIFKNRLNQDYDYVVCYPKKSILRYLNTLNQSDIERVEVLLSTSCANCPRVLQHSTFDSINNLNQNFETLYKCYYASNPVIPLDPEDENNIMSVEQCLALGVNKFKYNGRGENVRVNLQNNVERLVKPEYQKEIFEELWKKYINSEQLF